MSYETPSGGERFAAPTSSLAVISLVAGILGVSFFPLIGSIVAVITGPMAKKEIMQSGGAMSGDGMATAGTILGWIGIALGVLGFCLAGVILAIPLCLIPFGVIREGSYWLAPTLFAFLF